MREGISNHLLHAYYYICVNFSHPEDEIYLVGFSRGAYTAYLLAAFICRTGLLKKSGLERMNHLHELWRKWGKYPKGVPAIYYKKTDAFAGKNPLDTAIEDIDNLQQIRLGVKIEACILWDTVSALAFPAPRGIEPWKYTEYEFVDNNIPNGIQNLFHALALNERRRDFKPLIFADPPQGMTLRQCWFLGSHGNVGGGYDDFALSNISLAWMIAQLATYTGLRTTDVCSQLAPRVLKSQMATEIPLSRGIVPAMSDVKQVSRIGDITRKNHLEVRKGKIGESYKGFYHASGSKERAIESLNSAKDFVMNKFSSKPSLSSSSSVFPDDPSTETQEPRLAKSTTRESLAAIDKVNIGRVQTIHFTVRHMLDKNYYEATCPVLSGHQPIFDYPSKSFVWRRNRNVPPQDPDGMYEIMDVCEEELSMKELALYKIWIEGEAKVIEEEQRLLKQCRDLIKMWIKEYGERWEYDGPGVSIFGPTEDAEHYEVEWLRNQVETWSSKSSASVENCTLAQMTLAKFLGSSELFSDKVLKTDETEWGDEIDKIDSWIISDDETHVALASPAVGDT